MALQALHVASLASLHALSARPVHAQTKCGNAIIIQKCQPVCSSRREEKQSLVRNVAQQAAVFGAIAVLGLSPASGPALADIQDDITTAASGSFQTTKNIVEEAEGNLQKLVPAVSDLNLSNLTDKASDQVDSVKAFGSAIGRKLPSSEESSIPSAPSDVQAKYSERLAEGGDNENEQKLNSLFDSFLGKSADATKKGAEEAISKLPGQ